MHVQLNTDNTLHGSQRLSDIVSAAVEGTLGRFGEKITRVEVYFQDENGADKGGGADKVCRVDAKVAGLSHMATTHKAGEVVDALDGALEKMEHMLDHHLGRLDKTKGNISMAGDQQGF